MAMERYGNGPRRRVVPHEYESQTDYTETYYDDDYTHDDEGTYDSRTYDSRTYDSRSQYTGSYTDTRDHNNRGRVHPNDRRMNGSGHNNMNNHASEPHNPKQLVDFDSYASDSEKLSAILKCSDVECHKHNLSIDYYLFRKYGLFLPTVFLTLFISMVGFVVQSDIIKDHMKVGDSTTREFLSYLIACLAFLVLVFTLLANSLDYNSKINFHKGAALDLETLCDRIRMYRVERTMDEAVAEEEEDIYKKYGDDESQATEMSENASIPPTSTSLVKVDGNGALAMPLKKQMAQQRKNEKKNDALTKTLVNQKISEMKHEQENFKNVIEFYGYHTALQQITIGCKDDVPIKISKFFEVMETRVELMSLGRTLGCAEEGMEETSGRMRKNQIIRLCANEIVNEVSGYWAWPIMVPNVDHTIECALKRVGQLLNMNYRAQRRCKMIPCCPIPLCCKKKTSNNVFAIINEGIDQRELDMMQAERTELIKMEKDRTLRRLAGPEEVLELKNGGASVGGKQPKGMRGENVPRIGNGGGSKRGQYGYYDDEASRPSIDPDGDTFAGMATEATGSLLGSKVGYPQNQEFDEYDEDEEMGSYEEEKKKKVSCL